MANESTPNRTISAPSVQERTLRIDGERTAAMYTLSIRVARLDNRLRELAGVPNAEGRKQYRQATEGFQRLLGEFEDRLTQIEKDADMNSRRGARSANGAQARRSQQPRTQVQATAVKPGASKTAPVVAPIPAAAPEPSKATATTPTDKARQEQKPPQPNAQQSNGQQPKGKPKGNSNKGDNPQTEQQNKKSQQQPKTPQAAAPAAL